MKNAVLLLVFCSLFPAMGYPQIRSGKAADPEEGFRKPPSAAGPYVWWHWMGNNITNGGITADLEAMKNAGIGGATIFNLSSNADKGGFMKNSYTPLVSYHNPEWWKLVRHAASETERLGLELGMHNCVGYTASGGPWITPELSMQEVVWTALKGPMSFVEILAQPPAKLGYYRDIAVLAVPAGEPSPEQVTDLTSLMKPDGSLNWDVPAGSWTIYRFGHTATGRRPRPVPEDIISLEADKMSSEAMSFHMHQVLDPLKENLGPLAGKSLKHILFDSYEAGYQNWTPRMREEFRKRRGYDIIPWLPVLAGHAIGGKERASRFEWDLKTTISEMMIEYGFMLPGKMISEMGLQDQVEPYGGPFDEVEAVGAADLPMVEFWTTRRSTYGGDGFTIPAARALGKNILAAEAFTGDPQVSQWSETPAFLKASGDSAYTNGINRLVLHHWVHQPFPDNIRPGMCMGWWGTHFGRNQTWFEPGKAWVTYLARCQWLLQRGEAVSDYCSLEFPVKGSDVISRKMLLQNLSVVNGRFILNNGRSYLFLVLPNSDRMLPEVAGKIRQLVADGGIVIGPRPVKSPSLHDWPDADIEVSSAGREVWGNADGKSVTENKYGKGRIIWGRTVEDVLSGLGVREDVKMTGLNTGNIKWCHRREGKNDYYFFANLSGKQASFIASVRIEGKTPEFWYPETGKTEEAAIWQGKKGYTDIDVRMNGNEAIFLVFRRPSGNSDPVAWITASVPDTVFRPGYIRNGSLTLRTLVPGDFTFGKGSGAKIVMRINSVPKPLVISGGWSVSFKTGKKEPFMQSFDSLISWSSSADNTVKYFSGTAYYSKKFTIPAEMTDSSRLRVLLDLGEVRELADVKVNSGHAVILWHYPFVTDITGSLKPGENNLEIAVTNTWANRMIGDEQYPEDCVWGKFRSGRSLLEIPDWLIKNRERPSRERTTFATWNYFTRESPLLKSGLLGPVRLVFEGVAVR
jgi:hypothetical protein